MKNIYILGNKDEKTSKSLLEIIGESSRAKYLKYKGKILIILPDFTLNLKEKCKVENLNFEDELYKHKSEFSDYAIVLNLDSELHYSNISYMRKGSINNIIIEDESFLNKPCTPVLMLKAFNGKAPAGFTHNDLGSYVLEKSFHTDNYVHIVDYDKLKEFEAYNLNTFTFLNENFRFEKEETFKEQSIEKPVEVLGFSVELSKYTRLYSFNCKKINFLNISTLTNIISRHT